VAAGAMTVAVVEEEDDLFETLADEDVVVDKKNEDSMRSIAALAARFGSKSSGQKLIEVERAAGVMTLRTDDGEIEIDIDAI
jgi:hypothetical protein